MSLISVIGEGAWGMAIAGTVANNGYQVNLWCYDKKVVHSINQEHHNELYMPGKMVPPNIIAYASLEKVVKGSEWIFVSTPIKYLRDVLQQCKPFYSRRQRWVILSKGIENESLMLPSQMLAHIFGSSIQYAVLGGPSFAKDVINKDIVGVVVAASNRSLARDVATIVKNDYFKPFIIDDTLGIQLGGALKNVVAIIMGCTEKYAESTRAFIFTRAWQEMCALAKSLGAKQDTLLGLAGIGDLFLTVSGSVSRNLRTGRLLSHGTRIEDIEKKLGAVSEGLNTIKSVKELIDKYKLTLPLFQTLYRIVFEGASTDLLIEAVVHEEVPQAK